MSRREAERERLLAEGRELLRAWGVPGDAPETLGVLRRLIGRARAGDLAIVERLGEIASPASAEILQEVESRSDDRLLRREVHRARYRLARRGVPLPPPSTVRSVAAAAASEPEGWMSAVTGNGDRLVWLVHRRPGGGLWQLAGVVNEPEGLRDATLLELSRKRLRRLQQELAAAQQMRLVTVPWRYVDFLLWEGYERARAGGGAPADLPHLRSRMLREAAAPVRHPIYDHLGPDALRPAESDATILWEEPELSGWVLARDKVQPFIDELRAVQESPLVLNRFQQQDRVEEVFARAGATLLEDGARRYQRRLEDMAYYFWQTGRADAARRAGAVALALAERPATEVAFLQTLVRRSVSVALEEHLRVEAERRRGALVLPPEKITAPRPPRRGPTRA